MSCERICVGGVRSLTLIGQIAEALGRNEEEVDADLNHIKAARLAEKGEGPGHPIPFSGSLGRVITHLPLTWPYAHLSSLWSCSPRPNGRPITSKRSMIDSHPHALTSFCRSVCM